MTEHIHHTGRCLILDSGFCVLRGLIELLRTYGIFGSTVIKKQRYWPKYINGDDIKEHFKYKEIGTTEVRTGTLLNTKFNLFLFQGGGLRHEFDDNLWYFG